MVSGVTAFKFIGSRGEMVKSFKPTNQVVFSSVSLLWYFGWKHEVKGPVVSFAQWQYHNQWGSTEMWLLLVENFNQCPATKKWNNLLRQQFLTAPKRAVILEKNDNLLMTDYWCVDDKRQLRQLSNINVHVTSEVLELTAHVCSSILN